MGELTTDRILIEKAKNGYIVYLNVPTYIGPVARPIDTKNRLVFESLTSLQEFLVDDFQIKK